MNWLHDIAYLFGGAFLSNGVPHFVSGVMGRPFPSPFAKPPGRGLSSPVVNVLWGSANLAIAYLLLARVGTFHVRAWDNAIAAGLGFGLIGLLSARLFGQVGTGEAPRT